MKWLTGIVYGMLRASITYREARSACAENAHIICYNEYMLKKELRKTRRDQFGVTTEVFTGNGNTIVTDSTGNETYLFRKFPRTVGGLDEALVFFDTVKEMAAQSELAGDAMMNEITIH